MSTWEQGPEAEKPVRSIHEALVSEFTSDTETSQRTSPEQLEKELLDWLSQEFPDFHVPIFFDAHEGGGSNLLASCHYFSFVADHPLPGYSLTSNFGTTIPFLLTSVSGVIYRPLGDSHNFSGLPQIVNLFNALQQQGFAIDLDGVRVPAFVLQEAMHRSREYEGRSRLSELTKSSVFRVPMPLFVYLCRFHNGRSDVRALLSTTRVYLETSKLSVYYSHEETMAFQEWSKIIISQWQEFS